jgi:hypothetical protein
VSLGDTARFCLAVTAEDELGQGIQQNRPKDPADCRGTFGGRGSREAGHVRYVDLSGPGTTSGSQSHPANFNHANLALACATAREALIDLAATRLAVPRDAIVVDRGVASVRGDRNKSVTYGELVGGRSFSLPVNANAKRKPPREWTVLGKPMPRVDLPAMATAQLEYVHNVRVPGMVHGAVVRPPEVGAALEAWTKRPYGTSRVSSRWSSARTSSASSPKSRGRRFERRRR